MFFTSKDLLFKELHFVSLAMSDDETRYFMRGVHFSEPAEDDEKNVRIAATDGKQLHIAVVPLEKLKAAYPGWSPGLYAAKCQKTLVSIGKKIDAEFPEYQRVVDDPKPRGLHVDLSLSRATRQQHLFAFEIAFHSRLQGFINPDYLRALYGYAWVASMTAKDHKVRFDCTTLPLVAFIAPMRTDDGMLDLEEANQPVHAQKVMALPQEAAVETA